MGDVTYIGKANWRNHRQLFGIKDSDRLHHIYCIGKTGTGKSTLLLNMAISDIERGNGFAVIDPHGDLALALLNYISEHRVNDVIYFNPSDTAFPVPFNPLLDIEREVHHLAVAGLIATFKRIWTESWGPRLEHVLRFSLFTLLESERATLLDLPLLLTNPSFQKEVLREVRNPLLLNFWKAEMDRLSPFMKAEVVSPILNKFGLFQVNDALRLTIGQRRQTWKVGEVMSGRKIFIANLSKGVIGEDASSLLGSMLVNAFQLSALSRASIPEEERVPFYLYVDEAHSFLSYALADILAEARKYGLSLFLTNQYLDQLHEKVRSAIFGNVGTLIAFRLGASDARVMAQEFHPVFNLDDFINLPRYHIYLKLMVDGATSKPFSAITLSLPTEKNPDVSSILQHSKSTYGIRTPINEPVNNSPASIAAGPQQGSLF